MKALKNLNRFMFAVIIILTLGVVVAFMWPVEPQGLNVEQQRRVIENAVIDAAAEAQEQLEAADTPAPLAYDPYALEKLPAFQLNGIGTADFSDQVMVLNFFSMWCPKCQNENILLNEFHDTYNVPIYGINMLLKDEDSAEVFFADHGNPFKKWGKDDFNLTMSALDISAVPMTIVITPDLRIHWRHSGEMTKGVLEKEMLPILQRLAAPESIFRDEP